MRNTFSKSVRAREHHRGKVESSLKGWWFRMPSRENSLCQSRSFKLRDMSGKGKIDLGDVDGSQIALGRYQDVSCYITRLELL